MNGRFLFFSLSPSSIYLIQALTISLIKQTNRKMYMHYTVHCTIRTRAQSARRQHRRRVSEKNDMVTYKDSTQLV